MALSAICSAIKRLVHLSTFSLSTIAIFLILHIFLHAFGEHYQIKLPVNVANTASQGLSQAIRIDEKLTTCVNSRMLHVECVHGLELGATSTWLIFSGLLYLAV